MAKAIQLWADVPIDQRGEPWLTRRRHPRLWLTADRSRLVTDGDPEAATLAFGENEDPVVATAPVVTREILDDDGEPIGATQGQINTELSRRRVLFYAWLDIAQPPEREGCPAAVRDYHGLYHPCRAAGVPAGVLCAAHDPLKRAMASEKRRQRAEQFWRFNYQYCNWVGELVAI